MAYVDGFVGAVPLENKEKFVSHAKILTQILKEAGATEIVECWENDVPDGEVTSFPMAVKRKSGEAIVFSWILWPDKATRDAGMQKMMEDPRAQEDINPMPFDGKRIIFGGFDVLLKS